MVTMNTAWCETCGGVFLTRWGRFCGEVCRNKFYNNKRPLAPDRHCIDCGNIAERISGPALCVTCRAERKKAKKRKERTRVRARYARREHYTMSEIADRDGKRCHLCCGVVDMTLGSHALYGPTIDHVVPLAKGGDDTKDNVKLAHRYCNSVKGAT